jgi:hypothetical protein
MLPVVSIASVATDNVGATSTVVVTTNLDTIKFEVDTRMALVAHQQIADLVAAVPGDSQVVPAAKNFGDFHKDNLAEELITLKWLLDAGILNEHDFQEERARLLGF